MLSGCLSKSFCSTGEKIFHEDENLSFKITLKKPGDMPKDKSKQTKYWSKEREKTKGERESCSASCIHADPQGKTKS